MNLRFLAIGLALAGLALLAVLMGRLGTEPAPPAPAAGGMMAPPAQAPAEADPGVSDDSRRLAMQEAYADLEKERLMLNRQLSNLQTKLWNRRLPAARAQSIQQDMMAAQALLRSPPLLGAFFDAAGVRHESDRVKAALERLQEIEKEITAE